MTRLANLYNSKDFGEARKYCEELFSRYLRIFKPTGLFTEGHIKNKFFDRISEKYFYDFRILEGHEPMSPRVCVLSIFGFKDMGEALTDDYTFSGLRNPDTSDFIKRYWPILFPQRDFEKSEFDYRYADNFAKGYLYREVAMIDGMEVYVKKSNAKAFKKLCKELEKFYQVLPNCYWGYKSEKINQY